MALLSSFPFLLLLVLRSSFFLRHSGYGNRRGELEPPRVYMVYHGVVGRRMQISSMSLSMWH
ncbi:uncharacterized protein TRIVIDRAFT_187381 [Trichoderma virens Gv29-8]|uniref:Uncharacterized protein n=1 Tax=Hypocrea virens (strain Gv29-8 / FGSC 10586) TaxID=413071 RepID=G9N900_HYPVG|nr:uncharacterized protein TRIVIDRAFT_187381 [Trichoderma virens Gv29-8]EHK16422.1 hypothetical protein TRIVIDRAFT_187381 [Trichoderma virens Gv29-8]